MAENDLEYSDDESYNSRSNENENENENENGNEWRLKFDIKLNSASGPKIWAQGRHGDDKEKFSLFIRRVLEYRPDGEDGYQEGRDEVINAYGTGMDYGLSAGMKQCGSSFFSFKFY